MFLEESKINTSLKPAHVFLLNDDSKKNINFSAFPLIHQRINKFIGQYYDL